MGKSRCAATSLTVGTYGTSSKVNFSSHAIWYEAKIGHLVRITHAKQAKQLLNESPQDFLNLIVTPRRSAPVVSVTSRELPSNSFEATYPPTKDPHRTQPSIGQLFAAAVSDPKLAKTWHEATVIADAKRNRKRNAPTPADIDAMAYSLEAKDVEAALRHELSDRILEYLAQERPEMVDTMAKKYRHTMPPLAVEACLTRSDVFGRASVAKSQPLSDEQMMAMASRYANPKGREALASRSDLSPEAVKELLRAHTPIIVDKLAGNGSLPPGIEEELMAARLDSLATQVRLHPDVAAKSPLLSPAQRAELVTRALDRNSVADLLVVLAARTDLTDAERLRLLATRPRDFVENAKYVTELEADNVIRNANSMACSALIYKTSLTEGQIDALLDKGEGFITNGLLRQQKLSSAQVARVFERSSYKNAAPPYGLLSTLKDLTPNQREVLIDSVDRDEFASREDLTHDEKNILLADPTKKVGLAMAKRRDLTSEQVDILLNHKFVEVVHAALKVQNITPAQATKARAQGRTRTTEIRLTAFNKRAASRRFDNFDATIDPTAEVSSVTEDLMKQVFLLNPSLSAEGLASSEAIAKGFGGTLADLASLLKEF